MRSEPVLAVSAGEASGDLHAANLLGALADQGVRFRAWAVGGPRLSGAGAEILIPSEALSAMGLLEAAGRLPVLLRARRAVVRRFLTDRPDLFLPVDFGGFNLALAAQARRLGVPVVYYIPPKVWAWGPWRARKVRERVDEALVILPFEEPYWAARGVRVSYVGSPVADHVTGRRWSPEPGRVGLLPGSRKGEILRIWPLLLGVAGELARHRPLRFTVPLAPGVDREWFGEAEGVEFTDDALGVMERSELVIAASGTAALECALVGVPTVVVYRVNPLTYWLGRLLVRVPFVALPNLIAGREVVPEFVQRPVGEVVRASVRLLEDEGARARMIEGLDEVRRKVGEPGAARRAAERIARFLEERG
ncbi:MAG: lipid-A-disaccharide synthase [Deltaproteobacteria bacterium]|nr:lipid-A-disaccharide synthase [Deltaproteobacteria bacterium]